MQKIIPFLWFDNNAEEAVKLYTSVFKDSKIGNMVRYDDTGAKVSGMPKGSVMTIDFQINGQQFAAINGGPIFKFTPAISFIVTAPEIDTIFKKLSKGGEIMMPLDKYPFSEKYAFFKDKFGVAWQIMLAPAKPITPSLLFVGKDLGKAEAAVKFYTKVFKNSKINHMQLYGKGQGGKEGTVMFSSFNIEGQEFTAMDGEGPHKFTFNEAVSFLVNCETQEEIDYFWNTLTKGGSEQPCGWLKDKFGVSWQITPAVMPQLLKGKNGQKVMEAMLQMKKINIKTLEKASKS